MEWSMPSSSPSNRGMVYEGGTVGWARNECRRRRAWQNRRVPCLTSHGVGGSSSTGEKMSKRTCRIFVLMMSIPSLGTENPSDIGAIDLQQDLFPDYYGGPASAPSELKQEFSGHDFPNGGNNYSPVKENNSPPRIPHGSSGEGLPYAPINWPNAGDVWGWRAGKRVNSYGFYSDRFLSVPQSLRKPNAPKVFASKPTLERFLRSNFPDADIDAFFGSFSWKIPGVLQQPFPSSQTPSAPSEGIEDDRKEGSKITPRRTDRKRAPPPPPFITPTPNEGKKRQKTTKGSTDGKKTQKTPKGSAGSTKSKRQTRQGLQGSAPPPQETEDTNDVLDVSFLDDETGRAEFDNYLNSLDDILAQPLSEEPFPQPQAMHNFFAAEGEMAEARRKLSSLLDMDFPSLICFKDLDELASLASKLRKDPTLSAEQLVKLKLIEEIPSFCEVFLENRGVMEQADKFFAGLEHNRTKVTSLKQEFSDLKQQVTILQAEVDYNTVTIQDIDNQIAQLKARRAELTKLIDKKNKDKGELTYNQKLVANSIPKVVHEVQLANAKKQEWELKKENAVRREAEILAKFAPLKGFSL